MKFIQNEKQLKIAVTVCGLVITSIILYFIITSYNSSTDNTASKNKQTSKYQIPKTETITIENEDGTVTRKKVRVPSNLTDISTLTLMGMSLLTAESNPELMVEVEKFINTDSIYQKIKDKTLNEILFEDITNDAALKESLEALKDATEGVTIYDIALTVYEYYKRTQARSQTVWTRFFG